jgi:hypothetical protein
LYFFIFCLASYISLGIAGCVTHLYVPFSWHQCLTLRTTFPTFALLSCLSKREGAVLYIFNQLHNYHIIFVSLLIILEDSNLLSELSKSEGCVLVAFPKGEGRDGASSLFQIILSQILPGLYSRFFQIFFFPFTIRCCCCF